MNNVLHLLRMSIAILFLNCSCDNVPEQTGPASDPSPAVYQEKHRPQFHFSPASNWMNDPNGMFYYEGKYHLFYQYFPDSTVWGPMHWGHAESTDLLHWEHLPIALYPDSIGCIFSGGAVVDTENTSGLGSTEIPPILATFTHHDFIGEKAETNDYQKQSVAYSLDGGYEWTKYDGNPVIPNSEKIKDFRDPKVVWHEASQKWILVLAAYDKVKFYSSENLLDWKFISDFGIEGDQRLWECPDLIPMRVEDSEETKWVLIVSIQKDAPNEGTATSYFVGDFNGEEFKSTAGGQKWLDWGTDNYAFVTWNNIPKEDGRVLGIGWMSNWQYAQKVPTEKWRSAMTLPRELRLVESESELTLYSSPVRELRKLRRKTKAYEDLDFNGEYDLETSFPISKSELKFKVNLKETTTPSFGFELENDLGENVKVKFNKDTGKMIVDRTNSGPKGFSQEFFENTHSAPLDLSGDELDVNVLIDVSSVEIFINDGEVSFTSIFFPSKKYSKISFHTSENHLVIPNLEIHELGGVWK